MRTARRVELAIHALAASAPGIGLRLRAACTAGLSFEKPGRALNPPGVGAKGLRGAEAGSCAGIALAAARHGSFRARRSVARAAEANTSQPGAGPQTLRPPASVSAIAARSEVSARRTRLAAESGLPPKLGFPRSLRACDRRSGLRCLAGGRKLARWRCGRPPIRAIATRARTCAACLVPRLVESARLLASQRDLSNPGDGGSLDRTPLPERGLSRSAFAGPARIRLANCRL